MNIDVLLAGQDDRYIKKLAEIIKRKKTKVGDTLNIALFTDVDRLKLSLSDKKNDNRKTKYHIALIDESIKIDDIEIEGIQVIFVLTDESDRDGGVYPFYRGENALNIYKYQRVSRIIDMMVLEFAKLRDINKKGTASVYTFFSPVGGCGTSTIAAASAVALTKKGIKPLYVSFEFFNSTELFFNDSAGTDKGLYEVFNVIAGSGVGVITTIDAIKNTDKRGVDFLKKFTMWTEVAQIKPDDIEIFIDAARASSAVDAVILDLGGVYTNFTEKAFECADEIFVVADTDKTSLLKLNILLNDNSFYKNNHLEKTKLVFNKSDKRLKTENYNIKSVCHVKNISVRSTSELLDTAAGDLKGFVHNG